MKGGALTYLLNFKLTFARPVESDITMPRDSKDENFADFGGGEREMIERVFKIAIINQLHT